MVTPRMQLEGHGVFLRKHVSQPSPRLTNEIPASCNAMQRKRMLDPFALQQFRFEAEAEMLVAKLGVHHTSPPLHSTSSLLSLIVLWACHIFVWSDLETLPSVRLQYGAIEGSSAFRHLWKLRK